MKKADEILNNIQKELQQVNSLTFHDHNKKAGNETIYSLLFKAEKAVTEFRTMLHEECRNEINKIIS